MFPVYRNLNLEHQLSEIDCSIRLIARMTVLLEFIITQSFYYSFL